MHVKRLYRPTVREALAAARQELGAGALVLSTELVPAPGWLGWMGKRVVRLTAAAERPGTDAVIDRSMSVERPEVTAHRHSAADARRAGMSARLEAVGLTALLAETVVSRMTIAECRGGSETALRRALTAELDAARGDDDEFCRYEVFVGPPGVGKTTTIAKIAARERASKARPVGLVAADAFRAGAIEQLRCYATVLGAPFRVARSASELEQALNATRHTAFIDTAGTSPADPSISELFEVLEGRRGLRTHLVIAADTSLSAAKRIFDRYAVVKPSRVVITKLDEADSVVPIFNLVRERGLAVSYIANGQRVPEDLERATPACLAAALLQEPAAEVTTCH